MAAAIIFDSGLPKLLGDDGRLVEVPAEVVAQADEDLDILEICRRYAIKAGLSQENEGRAHAVAC